MTGTMPTVFPSMNEENRELIRKDPYRRRLRHTVSSSLRKIIRLIPWLVGVLVVIWAAGFFLVKPMAQKAISDWCNGAVYIEAGRFTGISGVRLKGVIIAEDTEGLVNAPIFRLDEVEVMFDPWKLLRGKLQVNSIRLSDFLFNATYESQDHWNFLSLLNQHPDSAEVPERLPLIEIRNGAMRVSRLEEQHPKTITTISLNGQVAVQTGKREYSFSLTTDGRFGFGGSTLSGSLKVGREGEKSRFAAEGKIQMPKTKVFENAWNLENVQLVCEFDKQELLLERCGFSMGSGHAEIQGAIRENADHESVMNLDVNLERFTLSDRYQRNAVVYSKPILELLDARLREFLTRFHPTGTGDIQLSFEGPLKDLSKTHIDGTILSRDVSIRDEEFPYRLDHLQGPVVLSGRNLTLNHLTAKHGPVDLQIDGSIQDLGPNAKIDIRTTSPNMQFDEDLYKALSPSLQQVWYSFTPSGTAGIDYHFQQAEDGDPNLMLTLDLKDTGLVYEHFPYPLENMTGKVIMKKDSVQLQDMVSHYDDGRRVTLNGYVQELESPQPKFDIHVVAERIPVDEELINAMPPSQQTFFDDLKLDAVADVNVIIFPNVVEDRMWDYTANIRVDGDRFEYAGFPLPMEDVHLTADVTDKEVSLHEFKAAAVGGRISMNGTVIPKGNAGERPGLCLELGLTHFDFNDTFWNAAGQDAERLLGKLRMRGTMDVKGRLTMNYPVDSCPPTDLLVECSDNPVLWDNRPVGSAWGQLHLENESVRFEEFQLKGLRLESIPRELLQGPLKAAYAGIQPQGDADMQIHEGTLKMGESGPDQIDAEGKIVFKNVTAGPNHVVTEFNGDIGGHLRFNRDANTWQTLAFCEIDHFKYRHWLVSNFSGHFAFDPNTRHFEGTDLAADFYDGKMIGDIEVDLSNEERIGYKLGFTLNDADLPKLLAADEQDVLNRVKQGLASGMLTLEGDLKSLDQSSGNVTVHVTDMNLGKQSLLGKILTAMQFKQPEEYVFSEVQAQARIRQSQVIIDDIRMVGKPLVFRGTGKLDFTNNTIEMDWVAYDRLLGNEDTILDLLARGIGSAIWKVEVRGSLDDPKIDAVFLSVLKSPLDIFKKKQ